MSKFKELNEIRSYRDKTNDGGWERGGRGVVDTVATHVRNFSIRTKHVSRETKDSAEQPIKHTDHQ